MTAKHSPQFRTGLKAIQRGDILVAPLRAYLANPDFRGFRIEVAGLGKRPYDGIFHPSTHPTWPLKALWLYLVAPSLLMEEPEDPSAILAMTAGSVWHAFIERALLDLGLLETNEVKFKDTVLNTGGSADGLVKKTISMDRHLFEFKTMKDMVFRKVESVADFIARFPGYYAQALEYMRMSGFTHMRFLLMTLTYPFEMKEFVIEFDQFRSNEIRDKYQVALQMAADGDVPVCDGCPKGTFCPARAVCETATHEQIKGWISGAQA